MTGYGEAAGRRRVDCWRGSRYEVIPLAGIEDAVVGAKLTVKLTS
jgi:hypothetical protein